MGFLGGVSRGELLKELRAELSLVRDTILSQFEDRIGPMESRLDELSSQISSLRSGSSVSADNFKKLESLLSKAEETSRALSAVRDYEVRVMSIQDGLQNLINVLHKEREVVRKDVDKFAEEKKKLESLREEIRGWRSEIQEKAEDFQTLRENVEKLEKRKLQLEQEIDELSENYLNTLKEASGQLDDQVSKLDRSFKFRELRLERLVRKEKELADSVVQLQERERNAQKAEERVNELMSEIARLGDQRDSLVSEIRELKETRGRLEKIVREMREAVLKP